MANRGLRYLCIRNSSAYPEQKITISENDKFSMLVYGSLNNSPCIGCITYQSNNINGFGYLINLTVGGYSPITLQVSGMDKTHFTVSGFINYGRYVFVSASYFVFTQ